MGAPGTPVRSDPVASNEPPASTVRGVWLSAGPVREPIQGLFLELLSPNQPNPGLLYALLEELGLPVKRLDVALEYLGLRPAGLDLEGPVPLHLVAPKPGRDPWRETLVTPGGDCPLGSCWIRATGPSGPRPRGLRPPGWGRTGSRPRYMAMVLAGDPHELIVDRLERESSIRGGVGTARHRFRSWTPPSCGSADGSIRVQFGSPAQTTRNLLREGVDDDHVFVLPRGSSMAGRTTATSSSSST